MLLDPIPYGRQSISKEDIDEVIEALQSDFLTQGPKVKEFEEKFAGFIGSKYAVAVTNGTAALHLSALALKIKPGETYLTTPITFAASANSVLYCGGEVEFVDIDKKTYNLDLNIVEEKLIKHPGKYKGIIPVDFAGHPVDMEGIGYLKEKYNLNIIEDACHAPGGYFINSKGDKEFCGNGNYSDLAVFSFHPVKHIATGEGGMVTTNSAELYQKLLLLRTHGITKSPDRLKENHGGWYYEMQELGYNYRLSDIHSALGISQLMKIEHSIEKRQQIADTYSKKLNDLPLVLPYTGQNIQHAFHLYVIQTKDRLGLYNYLKANRIFAQVHYIPVHLQPYYKKLGWKKGDLPVAEEYYANCLSLPMYPSLRDEEQDYVIEKIKEFIHG
jgi:UDP-4-amino-4,6-dideoxy-N-acetyl-beta-L-altrosamine transaminase